MTPPATTGASDAEPSPLPWFGPTLHELVPDLAPGTRSIVLRAKAGQAISSARHDPVRRELLRRADQASHGAVAALIAEMLTPPLPRHHPEDSP